MNSSLTIPEVYHNLNIVVNLLSEQKRDTHLIESVKIAGNILLVFEMMGIASHSMLEEETKL